MKLRDKGKIEVSGVMSKKGADEACRLIAKVRCIESACRGGSLLIAALCLLVKAVIEINL
ncbi:hypothetical protein L1285_18985 [Pseudoalteromonas sp. DL2-H2.2]|uniref:hypothetical protein n=1 Tax=Pseudoalteromonas sp. DL2-H2.2 TaxID=2908889 RepID=UPI001F15BA58|nr:hypothetical protein [Pseudoalteromonas sp. DL2-H2.2]MCF2910401.1 hypothetical protein [Pseudoalteromonas sp. DL2-H2.2]